MTLLQMQKNITTKNMENKNLTAVDWYFDKIKSHFEHDGDLYEVACMTYQLAKEMEQKQHGQTWDAALKAGEDRAWNFMRAYGDFDDYWDKLNKEK